MLELRQQHRLRLIRIRRQGASAGPPRPGRLLAGPLLAGLVTAALAAGSAAQAGAPAAPRGATVTGYDLGTVLVPKGGPLGPLPIRLWGAIGVPAGSGPHPLVVVAHGRHGDNCPVGDFDIPTWPCFDQEQRNDLGLRYLVATLARAGVIAVTIDLNGAYTAGWGEPDHRTRWPRVVQRTIDELAREAAGGQSRFGVPLDGRVDLKRIGVLAHSLSGRQAVALARRRADNDAPAQVQSGRGSINSLFLLAPISDGAELPDVETAIVTASCDGDAGQQGRDYLRRARRDPGHREPVVLAELEGANHNYFNRTLSRLGQDDAAGAGGSCTRRHRLSAREQRAWLEATGADFFATTLLRAPRPQWLRLHSLRPSRLHGERVRLSRYAGG